MSATKLGKLHDHTLCVMGGYEKEVAVKFNSLAPPLAQTVSYPLADSETGRRIYDPEDPYTNFVYTRRNNPTNDIFEKRMALIEGGEAGLACSSGMGAIFQAASPFLHAGAQCVISNRLYTRAFELFTKTFAKNGVEVRVVENPTDLGEWEAKVTKQTALLYVETPSNPGLVVSDIAALAKLADSVDAPLLVDNTLATPCATKPLELGATISIESVSKYISGNASLLGGVLVGPQKFVDTVRRGEYLQYGGAPSPFNSWLCLLSLESLGLRMERHTANAMAVAEFLKAHPKVGQVNYPGLPEHPQHELAKKQMNGLYGGLLSFHLKDQALAKAHAVMDGCEVIIQAIHENSGRSVICHPPSTNFADLGPEDLAKADIPPGLMRLSVGIEHGEDLIRDLDQALAAC